MAVVVLGFEDTGTGVRVTPVFNPEEDTVLSLSDRKKRPASFTEAESLAVSAMAQLTHTAEKAGIALSVEEVFEDENEGKL